MIKYLYILFLLMVPISFAVTIGENLPTAGIVIFNESSGTLSTIYNNTVYNSTVINNTFANDSYVPYNGANDSVNLGEYNISVGGIYINYTGIGHWLGVMVETIINGWENSARNIDNNTEVRIASEKVNANASLTGGGI